MESNGTPGAGGISLLATFAGAFKRAPGRSPSHAQLRDRGFSGPELCPRNCCLLGSSPFSQLGVAAVVIGRETSSAMALLAPPINRLSTPVRVRVCTLARLHVETRYGTRCIMYMRRDHAIDA